MRKNRKQRKQGDNNRWGRRAIVAVAGAGVTAAMITGATGTASAAQQAPAVKANSCHSQVEEKIQWPLDPEYRVIAWCDSLDAQSKARGVLDQHWAPDHHTEWFTDTGVKHYS